MKIQPIYRSVVWGLVFASLWCAPLFAQMTSAITPGFKNGVITTGDSPSTLYQLPSERGDSGQVPVMLADSTMDWVTISISGDTIIAGTDTILVSQIARDTANVRWKLSADTVKTDSMVKTTNLAFFEGDTTFIRNVRLGTSGGVGGNVTSATAISIDILVPTENSFATTMFYVDSMDALNLEVAREDAGDTSIVYLALAKADMRDSATVVWTDSVAAAEARAVATAQATMRDSVEAVDLDSVNTPRIVGADIEVLFDSDPSATTASGVKLYLENVDGVSLAFGEAVYVNSSGLLDKADADGSATMLAIGLVAEAISAGSSGQILIFGVAENAAWGWPEGKPIYVSVTAGGLTTAIVTGGADVSQAIGIATAATRILVMPNATEVIK